MLNNFKIRTKIFILSFVMMAFLLVITAFGYQNLSKSIDIINSLYHGDLVAIDVGGDLRTQTRANSANLYALILAGTDSDRDTINADIDERKGKITADIEKLAALPMNADQKNYFDAIKTALVPWQDVLEKTVSLVKDGKQTEAYEYYKSNTDALEQYQTTVRDMNTYNSDFAKAAHEENEKNTKSTIMMLLILVVFLIVFAILFTLYISRSIAKVP